MGDSGCNYMTAGRVISLGEVGQNFGSGMTGGEAFVYDVTNTLEKRAHEDVKVNALKDGAAEARLRSEVEEDARRTESIHARRLLGDWDNEVKYFKHVIPMFQPDPVSEKPPQFTAM